MINIRPYNNKQPILISQTEKWFKCQCVRCGKVFNRRIPKSKIVPKYCSNYCKGHDTKAKEIRKCKWCNKEFEVDYDSRRYTCSDKCKVACITKNAKYDKYIGKDGYVNIYHDGKRIKEHIYLMEKQIGRKLNKNECVHHKDYNRQNNSLDNLQLLTKSEHSKLHRNAEIEKYGKVKANISGWNKGLHMKSSWNAKKVLCIETGEIFDSARKCSLSMNGCGSGVQQVCAGKKETYKGFHFKYID